MNKKRLVTALLTLILALPALAQLKLPNTHIYLIPLAKTDSGYSLGQAQLISDWAGYDNQPSFSIDCNNIYYSTIRDYDRTDIYMYAIASKQNLPFVQTASVSEFSPMPTPDGGGISLVRMDDNNLQQIWIYYFDGTDPALITPQIKNVGYYCWINDNEMILRLELTDTTSKLEWLNLKTNDVKDISKAPGTSICKVPGEDAAYYIDKSHATPRLMRYNIETNTSDSLTTVPKGVDNFTATIENEVWLINKGVLYSWSPLHPAKWKKVYQFPPGILSNGYRLATSRDMRWLAMVVMPLGK